MLKTVLGSPPNGVAKGGWQQGLSALLPSRGRGLGDNQEILETLHGSPSSGV